jgi:hypothetical protein
VAQRNLADLRAVQGEGFRGAHGLKFNGVSHLCVKSAASPRVIFASSYENRSKIHLNDKLASLTPGLAGTYQPCDTKLLICNDFFTFSGFVCDKTWSFEVSTPPDF